MSAGTAASLASSPVIVVMTALKEPALKRLTEAGFHLVVTGSPAHAVSAVVLSARPPEALVVDLAHPQPRVEALLRQLQQKKAKPAYILLVNPTGQIPVPVSQLAVKQHAEICPGGFDIPQIASQLREALGLAA